ncbi:MAG: hypothetical protein FWD76_00620, partial [Firmicutes bacterium]|nr:hypothetical protein [Bacillota bacterium]
RSTLFGTLSNIFDSGKLSLLGLNQECPKSGDLTLTLSKIERVEDSLVLSFDTRLPLTVDNKEFERLLLAGLKKYNISSIATYNTIAYKPNHYIDPQSPLIQTLLGIYHKHTGQPPHCIQIGGGTYARELKNAVAFGLQFPDVEVDIHKPNEKYRLDHFALLVDIYYDAFLQLCNQD